MAGKHIGWRKSHYIEQYYEDCKKLGMDYTQMLNGLMLVETDIDEHEVWHLFVDNNRKYWFVCFNALVNEV